MRGGAEEEGCPKRRVDRVYTCKTCPIINSCGRYLELSRSREARCRHDLADASLAAIGVRAVTISGSAQTFGLVAMELRA